MQPAGRREVLLRGMMSWVCGRFQERLGLCSCSHPCACVLDQSKCMLLTQMVGVGELTADPGSSLWGSLADEGALYDCLSQVCLVAILAVCDYLSARAWLLGWKPPCAVFVLILSSPALTAPTTLSGH